MNVARKINLINNRGLYFFLIKRNSDYNIGNLQRKLQMTRVVNVYIKKYDLFCLRHRIELQDKPMLC